MAKKEKKTAGQEKESSLTAIKQKFKQSPALYIGSVFILVLVTVTFVLGDALSGGIGTKSAEFTFGYYDKAPINWVAGNMFAQYYSNAYRNAQSQGYDPNESWISYQIWRQAYEAAVVHTAIMQIMKRSKYTVPEKTVDRNVAQLPQFQDNGKFSRVLWNQMHDQERRLLWRQTNDELAKFTYYKDYFNLLIPKAEANFIALMGASTRTFDMVSFNVDEYPDSEFRYFAQENIELFGKIHLSKITVNNEREAKRILESVKNGTTTFEEAARSQSQDNLKDMGGDMGSRYYYALDREIPNIADRRAVVSLKQGEISDVITAGENFVIFRIEEELIEADLEDYTIFEGVRYYVRNFERGKMEDWAISQAREFIGEAKKSNFSDEARSRNLVVDSFGPLSVNYGGIDIFTSLESFSISIFNSQELGTLALNENFWKTAFSTEVNTPSEPLVQGKYVLVFLPTEETEAGEDYIENIASMYSDFWLNGSDEYPGVTQQSLQYYFINHKEKMVDNFRDAYRSFVQ
ncbi:MAG: SurA N-terminal domain-containing protein [Treponema sp.]|nr:SurA N-terminal domain-containing protein [Treponema sp.]MCL2250821.1 SurA N-terminal domain-containing protein [Treponema sp.]